MLLAHHNSFVMVVNSALGGDNGAPSGPPPKPGDKGVKDLAVGHTSVDAAVDAINAAFTF